MESLKQIRESLQFLGKVSFTPIIRKLEEIVRVVDPSSDEPLSPQDCIQSLKTLEKAYHGMAAKSPRYINSLEEEFNEDDFNALSGVADFSMYIPLVEYDSPDAGLMHTLQQEYERIDAEVRAHLDRIGEALGQYEEESSSSFSAT